MGIEANFYQKLQEYQVVSDAVPTHPLYDRYIWSWLQASLAYEGGPRYINAYLREHPAEVRNDWLERRIRAVNENHVRAIAETYASLLMQEPPRRELADIVDPAWLDDADLYGNSMDDQTERATVLAQLHGRTVAIVDRVEPGGERLSFADDMALGVRPYVRIYSAENVVNWSVSTTGELNWLMVREQADDEPAVDRDGDGVVDPLEEARSRSEYQYRVWTKREWILYELTSSADDDGNESEQLRIKDRGPHPCECVPASWLYFGRRSQKDPIAPAPLNDIVPHQARIMNLYSYIDEQLAHYAFSILVVGDKTYRTLKATNWSVKGALGVADEDTMKPFYLSPDTAQVGMTFDQIRGSRDIIRHLAGLGRSNEDSAQQPSGEALRHMTMDKTARLRKWSQKLAAFEQRILQLMYRWSSPGASWNTEREMQVAVTYNSEFIESEVEQALAEALSFRTLELGGLAEMETMKKTIRAMLGKDLNHEQLEEVLEDFETRWNEGKVGLDANALYPYGSALKSGLLAANEETVRTAHQKAGIQSPEGGELSETVARAAKIADSAAQEAQQNAAPNVDG